MALAGDTLLVLTGVGVPRFSARECTQTLEPIDQAAHIERSGNGGLMDLSHTQFRKYSSEVSCADHRGPAVDSIFPGAIVTVDCVCELTYPAGGSPGRPVVPGSSQVTEHGYTRYRPRLQMMVMSWNLSQDEYGATVSWSMRLEEV